MGSSEQGPKEFQRSVDIIPLKTSGISNLEDFKEREIDVKKLEHLKSCGLTDDEIQLYHDMENGVERIKIENRVLREKLQYIYSKLEAATTSELAYETEQSPNEATPSTSNEPDHLFKEFERKPTFYPPNHPMNSIKELEKDMFGHLRAGTITPITKRRKLLRRLQRKQDSLDYDQSKVGVRDPTEEKPANPNSQWDVKEVPKRHKEVHERNDTPHTSKEADPRLIGPRQQTCYTIRDNKIVRLEPIRNPVNEVEAYRAVDIVVPVNEAEERLLEGTKLSVDQIRSIERFKHYQPGRPSKVLFLKNISPAASFEDISILFNQYVHENQAPVHVRLMTGRLRGQAFVHFQNENVAIKALEDVNGTVVKGRPVVAQFGKNSNNIQNDNR